MLREWVVFVPPWFHRDDVYWNCALGDIFQGNHEELFVEESLSKLEKENLDPPGLRLLDTASIRTRAGPGQMIKNDLRINIVQLCSLQSLLRYRDNDVLTDVFWKNDEEPIVDESLLDEIVEARKTERNSMDYVWSWSRTKDQQGL